MDEAAPVIARPYGLGAEAARFLRYDAFIIPNLRRSRNTYSVLKISVPHLFPHGCGGIGV